MRSYEENIIRNLKNIIPVSLDFMLKYLYVLDKLY
jgi:hypothetical protein